MYEFKLYINNWDRFANNSVQENYKKTVRKSHRMEVPMSESKRNAQDELEKRNKQSKETIAI